MISTRLLAAAALAAVLSACGDSDPQSLIADGNKALNTNDPNTALEKFTEAATALKPGDPQYLDAKLGVVEALVPTDAQKASDEFMALVTSFPDQVGEKQFIQVGGRMITERKFDEAAKLIDKGIKRADGESPKLHALIERIKQAAANDSNARNALQQTGYLQ